jgi:hypothetical protein
LVSAFSRGLRFKPARYDTLAAKPLQFTREYVAIVRADLDGEPVRYEIPAFRCPACD